MSVVSVLAAGTKADSGTGSAVDVTGCAALKLAAVMKADLGLSPQLRLTLETASAATGAAWREIYAQSFNATLNGTWPSGSTARIVVQPDNFVRARWETRHTGNLTAGLDLAITGVGSPDA